MVEGVRAEVVGRGALGGVVVAGGLGGGSGGCGGGRGREGLLFRVDAVLRRVGRGGG